MKVGVCCRFPWFLSFGGAEVQAMKYVEKLNVSCVDVRFVDYYNKDDKYDLLHFVGVDNNTLTWIMHAKNKGIKVAVSPVFYLNENKVLKHVFYKKITGKYFGSLRNIYDALKLADTVLPNSNAEREQLKVLFGAEIADKSKVIYNGFEADGIDNDFYRNIVTGDFMLCSASIEQRKNTLNLIKSFNLKRRDFQLVLVGGYRGSDSSYHKAVESEINSSQNNIKILPFLDNRNDLVSLYKNAFAHIMPSYVETPGISNLEAAYHNNYLIMGNSKPVREYFDCMDVVFVEQNNINEMSSSIDRIYRRYKENGEIIHPNIQKYTWDNVVKSLMDEYFVVCK